MLLAFAAPITLVRVLAWAEPVRRATLVLLCVGPTACVHRIGGCALDDFGCVSHELCARTYPPDQPVRFGPRRGDRVVVSVDPTGQPTGVTWRMEIRPGMFEAFHDTCE